MPMPGANGTQQRLYTLKKHVTSFMLITQWWIVVDCRMKVWSWRNGETPIILMSESSKGLQRARSKLETYGTAGSGNYI